MTKKQLDNYFKSYFQTFLHYAKKLHFLYLSSITRHDIVQDFYTFLTSYPFLLPENPTLEDFEKLMFSYDFYAYLVELYGDMIDIKLYKKLFKKLLSAAMDKLELQSFLSTILEETDNLNYMRSIKGLLIDYGLLESIKDTLKDLNVYEIKVLEGFYLFDKTKTKDLSDFLRYSPQTIRLALSSLRKRGLI